MKVKDKFLRMYRVFEISIVLVKSKVIIQSISFYHVILIELVKY